MADRCALLLCAGRRGKMREYIKDICRELEFPAEAEDTMLRAWDEMLKKEEAAEIWKKWLTAYEMDIHMDYKAALGEIDMAAQTAGVHKYTAEQLFFLCLTKHLKQLYQAQKTDLKIWHDSCMDLKWKLMECHKMYGIWGSFVAFWEPGFFDMTRFALGRLQFELIDFPDNYEQAGREKPQGMRKVINVHIPSSGKLNMEECHASYRQAAAFFADAFPGDTVAFYCWSWMLFAPHKAFLKPDCGVIKFMNEYDIYHTGEEDGDLWRIFNRTYENDPDVLPEDTSMQRAYKAWLKAGNHAGYGEGIFYLSKNDAGL